MNAYPSNKDLLSAAIYASNKMVRLGWDEGPPQLRVVTIVGDAEWKEDDDGLIVEDDAHRKRLTLKFTTKFRDSTSCEKLSCFPYTYTGKVCKPEDREHKWRTITGQEFVSCQDSCYNISLTWNATDPDISPTMSELTYFEGKCYIVDSAAKIYALFPQMRSEEPTPGITNVPMWHYISDPSVDPSDIVRITSEYCSWFGMNFEHDDCHLSFGDKIGENLLGTTFWRYIVKYSHLAIRNKKYVFLSDGYEGALKTVIGRRIDRQVRATAVDILPQYSDRITNRKNSRQLLNNDSVYVSLLQPTSTDARIETFDDDDNNKDDHSNSILDGILGGGFLEDLIGGVLVDQAFEGSIALVVAVTKRLIARLGYSSSVTLATLLKMGGKQIITSTLKSVVLRQSIRVAGTQLAKLVAASVLRSLTMMCNVITWALTIVSIAGLILDIIDVGNFSMQLNQSFVRQITETMYRNYRTTYGTGPFVAGQETHLMEITPETIFHMSKMKPPQDPSDDIASALDADENVHDEEFARELEYTMEYLVSRRVNSYGQKLDWDADPPDKSLRTLTVDERSFLQHRLDRFTIQMYEHRFREAMRSQHNEWQYASTAVFASGLFLAFYALRRPILWIGVVVFFAISYLLESRWTRRTIHFTTVYNKVLENVARTVESTEPVIARAYTTYMKTHMSST